MINLELIHDRGYEVAKNKSHVFEGSHNVHTPQELVEEVLMNIPNLDDGKTFLVLFNVEFVFTLLRTYEVNSSNITFYSDHSLKSSMIKYAGCKVIDKLDQNMKFDVVVGNPPYQDGEAESSKKAWPEFVKKAFEVCSDGGYVAMLTPNSWTNGKTFIFDYFKNKQCLMFSVDESHHFPKVGTTVSYFVFLNLPQYTHSFDKLGNKIDFSQVNFVPKTSDLNVKSILSKLFNHQVQLSVEWSYFCEQRRPHVSSVQSHEFQYKLKHTAKQIRYSSIAHPNTNTLKVLFPISSAMKAELDMNKEWGTTQHYAWIEVSDVNEGNNICLFLHSKLVSFLRKFTSTTASWDTNVLKKIPAVDFSKPWTDAELYQHFNLNQDEINFIESNVK